METPKITTNRHKYDLASLAEAKLPKRQKKEFDYIKGDDVYSPRLFKYKNYWYDTNEFMRAHSALKEWDGYQSDSYFSAIVIKYCDDYEQVLVGTWIC